MGTDLEVQPNSAANKDKNSAASSEQGDSSAVERGNWGGQLEFFLTCIGYAVGLGNVWRFPYLCYKNGGGAFLIPYFTMLVLVGMPLFFLELTFGQFSSQGPLSIWQVNPLMKGLGYAMLITNTVIALYYNVIIAWSFYYLFASFTDQLPWEFCGNWWNTNDCHESDFLRTNCTRIYPNGTSEGPFTYDCCDIRREEQCYRINATDVNSPSEEYFYNRALQMSSGMEEMGTVVWQLALTLLLAWTIVFFVLNKGIQSLGKVVYFSSTFPYVLLTIMLIRGVTLEGASEGIEYYLKPDFSRLADAEVWSDATTQIFFSLSACQGGLIAMASFNKFHHNCFRDSIIVPLINCGTSFYAGFAIFSVLGFMANEKGVTVSEVADEGPGLVFVAYPEALTQMPVAPLWSVLFFIMLVTLGFSSEFSMAECVLSAVSDEFPVLRSSRKTSTLFRACVIISFYLITLSFVTEGGFYWFSLVDKYISGFPLLIVGMLECFTLMYLYGYQTYAEDVELMLGRKPYLFYRVTWCVVTPLILLLIIIATAFQYEPYTLFDGEYVYPEWAIALAWVVVALPLVCIPGVFIFRIMADGGCQAMVQNSKPTKAWGPALKEDRGGRYYVNTIVFGTSKIGQTEKPIPLAPWLLNNTVVSVVSAPHSDGSSSIPTKKMNYEPLHFPDSASRSRHSASSDSTPRNGSWQPGGETAVVDAIDEAIGVMNFGYDVEDSSNANGGGGSAHIDTAAGGDGSTSAYIHESAADDGGTSALNDESNMTSTVL